MVNEQSRIPNHLQWMVVVARDLDSEAFVVEPGVLDLVVGPEAGEPGDWGTVGFGPGDIAAGLNVGSVLVGSVPAGSVPAGSAAVEIGAAYIGGNYHNTIDHIAVYTSFDFDILDNYSYFSPLCLLMLSG